MAQEASEFFTAHRISLQFSSAGGLNAAGGEIINSVILKQVLSGGAHLASITTNPLQELRK